MPNRFEDLMGQLAVRHTDPALVATFAEELARPTPADELVSGLVQFVAELSREDAKQFSSTFASQLAAQADAMVPQDGARLLRYAATLSSLSDPHGAERATWLSQSYALHPTLEVAQEAGEMLANGAGETSEAELVARAQLDSSRAGFDALTTLIGSWLEMDRLEEMVELLVSTAAVHPSSGRFLIALNAHLHPEDIPPEQPASAAEAPATEEGLLENTVAEQLSLLDVSVKETKPDSALRAAEAKAEEPETRETPPEDTGDDDIAATELSEQTQQSNGLGVVAPHRALAMLQAREALFAARQAGEPVRVGGTLAYDDDERPSGANKEIARARDRGAQGDWEGASNELAQAIRRSDLLAEQYHMMLELARIYEIDLDDHVRAERAYRRARAAVPSSVPALAFYRRYDGLAEDPTQAYALRLELHQALSGEPLAEFRATVALEMASIAKDTLDDSALTADAWTLLLRDQPSNDEALRGLRAHFRGSAQTDALIDHLTHWVEQITDEARRDEKVELLFECMGVMQRRRDTEDAPKIVELYEAIRHLSTIQARPLGRPQDSTEQATAHAPPLSQLAADLAEAETDAAIASNFVQIAQAFAARVSNHQEGIPLLEAFLRLDPFNEAVTHHLQSIRRRFDDSKQLYETFKRELTLVSGPDRIEVLAELARLATEALDLPDEAARWWKQILDQDPSHRGAKAALRSHHDAEESWLEYTSMLRDRVAKSKTRKRRVDALLELGDALKHRLEDSESAEAVYAEVISLSPFNSAARHALQGLYIARRAWVELRELFAPREDWTGYLDLLADTTSDCSDVQLVADIHVEMSNVAKQKFDDAAKAKAHLARALDTAPQRVDVARLLLETHEESLTPQARIAALEVIAAFAEEASERELAWQAVAREKADDNDPRGTHLAWGEALVLGASTGRVEVLESLLVATKRTSDWELTVELIDNALSQLPADASQPAVTLHRAAGLICRSRLHDHDAAIAHFRGILAYEPGDQESLEVLETIYLSRDSLEDLEFVWRTRADHAEDAAIVRQSLQSLGQLYEEVLLDVEKAAATYRELLDIDADDLDALVALDRMLTLSGDHRMLADSLEDVLPRMTAGERQDARRCQLAQLYLEPLNEPAMAAEHLLPLVESEGSQTPKATELLEEMVVHRQALGAVSRALEIVYRRDDDPARLAEMLELRLETVLTADEKIALADELAVLREVTLGQPERAFWTLCARFAVDSTDSDTWSELRRVASLFEGQEALAQLWREALHESSPKRPRDMESVNALRVELASLVSSTFGLEDEAVALYESVVSETSEMSRFAPVLEELEAIYSTREDVPALVRICLTACETVLIGQERVDKMLYACRLLRHHLHEPERAIPHYLGLYEQSPKDDSFAALLETTYREAEQWETLNQWLGDHAKGLSSRRDVANVELKQAELAFFHLDKLSQGLEQLSVLARDAHVGRPARSILVRIARQGHVDADQGDAILTDVADLAASVGDAWSEAEVLHARALHEEGAASHAAGLVSAAETLLNAEDPEEATTLDQFRRRAFEYAASALDVDPTNQSALEHLAQLAPLLEAYDEYAAIHESAARLADSPAVEADHWARAARVQWEHLADREAAVADWEALKALGPSAGHALYDEALEQLDTHLDALSEYPARLEILAERADRAADLRSYLEHTVALSELLVKVEQTEAAITALRGAARRGAEEDSPAVVQLRAQAIDALTELLIDRGERRELNVLLLDCAADTPSTEMARRWLLRAAQNAEEHLADPPLAISVYERLFDLIPDDLVAIESLDRLLRGEERWEQLGTLLAHRAELELSRGHNIAARDWYHELGSLQRDKLSQDLRAVESFARSLSLDTTHNLSLEALIGACDVPTTAPDARSALAEHYRRAGEESKLLETQLARVHEGDAVDELDALQRELTALYLQRGNAANEAWHHARQACLASDRTLGWSLSLASALQASEALGNKAILVKLLLTCAESIEEAEARHQALRADLEELTSRHWSITDTELLWRALIEADSSDAEAISIVEGLARSRDDAADIAEMIGHRIALTPEASHQELWLERGRLLSGLNGREQDALDALSATGELVIQDRELQATVTSLYRKTEQFEALADHLATALEFADTGAEVAHLRRAYADVLWHGLNRRLDAIALLSACLDADSEDRKAVEMLEEMWGEGLERTALFDVMQAHYATTGAWERQASLFRSTLDAELDESLQLRCLEKLADLQQDHLGAPDQAYETYKLLLERVDEPLEHVTRLEELTDRLSNWVDLADFYEGLIVAGKGDPAFIAHLAFICRDQLADIERAIRLLVVAAARDPDEQRYDIAVQELLTAKERWDALVGHHRTVAVRTSDSQRAVSARTRAAQLLETKLERPDEAAVELAAGYVQAPDNDALASDLARLLELIGDRAGLLTHLRRWTEQASDTTRPAVYRHLARVLMERGDQAVEGVGFIERAAREESPEPALEQLTTFLRHPDHDGQTWIDAVQSAADLFESLLDPDADAALLGLAEGARLRVLAEGPEAQAQRMRVATLLTDTGDYQTAFSLYTQCFEFVGGDCEIERRLDELTQQLGNWDTLASIYRSAVEQTRGADAEVSSRHLSTLGFILLDHLEQPEEGASAMERAITLAPPQVPLLRRLAGHYGDVAQYADQARILELWMASSAFDGCEEEVKLDLARVRMDALHDNEGAYQLLETLQPTIADAADTRERFATLCEATGRWEQLIVFIDEVLATDLPTEMQVSWLNRKARGQLQQLGDLDAAFATARCALDIRDDDLDSIATLEQIERLRGQWTGVDALLARRLEIAQDDDLTRELHTERALLSLEHLSSPDDALRFAEMAAELVTELPSQELVRVLERLLHVDATQRRAAELLTPLYTALQRFKGVIRALELRQRAASEASVDISLGVEIARVAEDELSDKTSALDAILTTLRRNPTSETLRERATSLADDTDGWLGVYITLEDTFEHIEDDDVLVDVASWLGTIYRNRQAPSEDQVRTWQRVLAAQPGHSQALLATVEIYESQGDWVKTVATCEQALTLAKLSPKDREAWLTRQVMATLDGLGDVETARETCQTWLETASSTQEPLRVMAAIERKRADWESLDEVLEQRIAVLTDPLQRSELLVERAHVALHERARHTLAVSYAKAASELIPFEADAEGLLVLLDELVQLSETRADAAVLLESRARETAQWERLCAALEARRLDTESSKQIERLTLELASIHRDHFSDDDAALRTLLQGFEDSPDRPSYHALLADLGNSTERWPQIFAVAEDAIEQLSDKVTTAAAQRWLAQAYGTQGHADAAIRTFEQLLELLPGDREALDTLEETYAQLERWSDVMSVLKRAVSVSDAPSLVKKAALTRQLEVAAQHLSDYHEVKRAARELLSIEDDNRNAVDYLQRACTELEAWDELDDALRMRAESIGSSEERAQAWIDRAINARDQLDTPESALEYLTAADQLINGGSQEQSLIDALRSLLRFEPLVPRTCNLLDTRFQARENWAAALELRTFQLELPMFDKEVERLTLEAAGLALNRLQDPHSALATLLQSFERLPASETIWALAVEATEQTGAYSALVDAGRGALSHVRQDERRLELALSLAELAETHSLGTETQKEILFTALEVSPGREDTFTRLEDILEALGDWTGLLRLLNIVLNEDTLSDSRRKGLLERKRVLAKDSLQDNDALREACEGLLALNPNDDDALGTIEQLARENMDWEALDLVIARHYASATDDQERLSLLLSRAENALEALQRPEAALNHALAADGLAARGPGPDRLVAILDQLLDFESTRGAAAAKLEGRYRARQQWQHLLKTLDVLRATYDAVEHYEAVSVDMARIARDQLGDPSSALSALVVALERYPTRSALRSWTEDLATQVGDWSPVFEAAERALAHEEQQSVRVDLGLWLGNAYEEHGARARNAVQAYERVLEVQPGHPEATAALSKLYEQVKAFGPLRELLQARLANVSGPERGAVLYDMARTVQSVDGPEASMRWWRELLWEFPNHQEGREAVDKLLDQKGTVREAAELLEPLYRKDETWSALARVLEILVSVSSEAVPLMLRLAHLYEVRLKDIPKAFHWYGNALKGAPQRKDILKHLERLAEQAGLWHELADAITTLAEIVDDRGRRIELHMRAARLLDEQLAQHTRAVDCLRAVLTLAPEHVEALVSLRRIYKLLNQPEPLVDVTRQLARLSDSRTDALELWQEVSELTERTGDKSGMLEASRMAVDIAPDDESLLQKQLGMLRELQRFDELEGLLRQKAVQAKDDAIAADFLLQLGQLKETERGDEDGAIREYREALRRDPLLSSAFEALVRLFKQLERHEDLAQTLCDRAETEKKRSTSAVLWHQAAEVFLGHLADVDRATHALTQALESDRDNIGALGMICRLFDEQERHAELLPYLTRLAELTEDPNERAARCLKAAGLYMNVLDDLGAAEVLYEAVLQLAPEEIEAIEQLVSIRIMQQRYAEAAELVEQLVDGLDGTSRAQALCTLAELYHQHLGRTQDARDVLEVAVQLALEDPALMERLKGLLEATDAWQALSQFMVAHYEEAENPTERCDRALGLARLHFENLDDPEGFQTWIKHAQQAKRDNPDVVALLIEFHTAREEWDSVAPRLEWLVRYMEAKRITSGLAQRAHELAKLLERLDQPHEALEYYKLSMQTDGTYLPNIVDFGQFLMTHERWDRALRLHQNLLIQSRKLSSDEVRDQVLYNLALSSHELGLKDKAAQYLERLLAKRPDHQAGLELKRRTAT